MLEGVGVSRGREIAVLGACGPIGLDHAVNQLLEAPLALLRAEGSAEVLRGHDCGCIEAPRCRELNPALLEYDLVGLPVGLDDVTALPSDLVIGVHPFGREMTLHHQATRVVSPHVGLG